MDQEIIQRVLEKKIIAIVRGINYNAIKKLAQALLDGGIELMEVTFNQATPEHFSDTTNAIYSLCKEFEKRMIVGAGTVTTPELVGMAADAGARYIVSPDTNIEVIHRTKERGLISMPGAMTATEVSIANNAGADFIKLFPAGNMGSGYIKALLGPLNNVRLLAVGGVDAQNAKCFLDAGALGVGVGGNLVDKKRIEDGDFAAITTYAKLLVENIK